MKVALVDHMGEDRSILRAMLVSTGKDTADFGPDGTELSKRDKGRLNFLMRDKHASPFEHAVVTFYVECSLAVRSEWQRHRTQSFNEFSFRYSTPEDGVQFHLPALEDMRSQVGKPGAYSFEPLPEAEAKAFQDEFAALYATIATAYEGWLERGLAREVARGILPVNTITKFYATANLRNWLNFLVLRNSENAMKEIRLLAQQVETIVAGLFPGCYEAWLANGRPQI